MLNLWQLDFPISNDITLMWSFLDQQLKIKKLLGHMFRRHLWINCQNRCRFIQYTMISVHPLNGRNGWNGCIDLHVGYTSGKGPGRGIFIIRFKAEFIVKLLRVISESSTFWCILIPKGVTASFYISNDTKHNLLIWLNKLLGILQYTAQRPTWIPWLFQTYHFP